MPRCLLDVDSRNGSCCPLDSLATLLGTPCYQFGSPLLFELSQFTQIQPGAASISQRFCFLLSCEQHSRSMVQISHYTTRLRWLYRGLRGSTCAKISPTPLQAWTLDKQRVNAFMVFKTNSEPVIQMSQQKWKLIQALSPQSSIFQFLWAHVNYSLNFLLLGDRNGTRWSSAWRRCSAANFGCNEWLFELFCFLVSWKKSVHSSLTFYAMGMQFTAYFLFFR